MSPFVLEVLLAAGDAAEPPLPMWVRIVSALGSALLFAAAVFGAVLGAIISWRSGRRDRWWTKTQWAIDRVHSKADQRSGRSTSKTIKAVANARASQAR